MCVARSTGTSFACTSNWISAYAILPSFETNSAPPGSYGVVTDDDVALLAQLGHERVLDRVEHRGRLHAVDRSS